METFAERLSYLLEIKKLRQSSVEQMANVSSGTINRWVKGRTLKPDQESLEKVAAVLDTTPKWLLLGKGPLRIDHVRFQMAERLKQARECMSLSPHEFAAKLGVSFSVLDRWENAEVEITPSVLSSIERIFRVRSLWLSTGEGTMFLGEYVSEPSNIRTDSPGCRLSLVFRILGIDRIDVTHRIGIDDNLMNSLMLDQALISQAHLIQFESVYNISSKYLLTGEGEMFLDPVPSIFNYGHSDGSGCVDMITIPMYNPNSDSNIPYVEYADNGDNMLVSNIFFRKHFFGFSEHLRLVTIEDDSMTPTLNIGDLVMVNISVVKNFKDGLWLIRMDDSIMVKRVQRLGRDHYQATCDNSIYQPLSLKLGNAEQLLGCVVLIIKKCRVLL